MRINEMHTRAGEADRPVHADQLDDASGRHQQSLRRDAQPAQRPIGETRARGRARRPAVPRLVRRQAQAQQAQHRFQRLADQVRRTARLLCAEHRHRRLPRLGLRAGVRRLGRKPSGDGQTSSRRRFTTSATSRPSPAARVARQHRVSKLLAKDARGQGLVGPAREGLRSDDAPRRPRRRST